MTDAKQTNTKSKETMPGMPDSLESFLEQLLGITIPILADDTPVAPGLFMREPRRPPQDADEPANGPRPVIINAPVVTDAVDGARPFLDMVASLRRNDSAKVAAAESERLRPYFAGLSRYLGEPAGTASDTLKKLTAPGALSALFNASAAARHNTILSEVVIAPQDIRHEGPAASLFMRSNAFEQAYEYRDNRSVFGFLQLYEDRQPATYSATVPVLLLDSHRMRKIRPYQADAMLRHLQRAMTLVNHDMLHHFTGSIVNNETAETFPGSYTAKRFGSHGGTRTHTPLRLWDMALPGGLYEEWAQIAHERVFLAPGNEAMAAEIDGLIDPCFDELERIRDAMMKTAKDRPDDARDTIDYFGMMMAHALTRVFPLNHPVMSHCMDRIERADPDPGKIVADCGGMLQQSGTGNSRPTPPRDILTAIGNQVLADSGIGRIIAGYRAVGLDLLPDGDRDVDYRQLKLFQLSLMSLDEVRAHMPQPVERVMTRLRDNMDWITLDMVGASAMTAGYQPPECDR